MIVVVDDRVTNREILTRLAQSVSGVTSVRAFADPVTALSFINERSPELVVTDYQMPFMNGDEFVRQCRVKLPDIPIIVVTAYEDQEYRYNALEAGATDFLLSPIDQHEFRMRASNLLAMYRQRRMIERRAVSLQSELAHLTKARDAAVRQSEDRLRSVIDAVPALICATDETGVCVFANNYVEALSDVPAKDAVGYRMRDLFGEAYAARHDRLDRLVRGSGRTLSDIEETLTALTGREHTFLTTKVPLRAEGGHVESVLTVSLDVTERKSYEQRLLHQATHDSVTNLPNRVFAVDKLSEAIVRARTTNRLVGLLLVDLDYFKNVNDTLGHSAGDQLLIDAGARITAEFGEECLVSRLGGDEFLLVVPDLATSRDAELVAQRILKALVPPFVVLGREVRVSASIGITVFPEHGETPEELLRKVDAAMYRAKSMGRDTYAVFTQDISDLAVERMEMERRLHQALVRGELQVYFQPVWDVDDDSIAGVEALLRWFSPDLGEVPPDMFIPLAEETGIILEIGDWVLRESCRNATEWTKLAGRPIKVSVNVSARQLDSPGFVSSVRKALAAAKLDPSLLELEITERMLLGYTGDAEATLRTLRALGVGLAIDDFGTGFGSILYLKRFPFNIIKLDREFVRDVDSDVTSAALTSAMIQMARGVGLEIVAEGVETERQLAVLVREGCNRWQGFHGSRPIPPERFVELLASGGRRK